MKVKVEIIWPDSSSEEALEKALNDLGADHIVSVTQYGDYQREVIYQIN